MTGEVAAILLLVVVHIAAVGVLVWAMLDGDAASNWRGWWPRDEPPDPPGPEPVPPLEGMLPLRDADPAPLRLREPGRLSDGYAASRRPRHAPEPVRTRPPV